MFHCYSGKRVSVESPRIKKGSSFFLDRSSVKPVGVMPCENCKISLEDADKYMLKVDVKRAFQRVQ